MRNIDTAEQQMTDASDKNISMRIHDIRDGGRVGHIMFTHLHPRPFSAQSHGDLHRPEIAFFACIVPTANPIT